MQAAICLHNWLRHQDLEDEDLRTAYVTQEMCDREDENGFRPGSWRDMVGDQSAFRDIHRTENNSATREAFRMRENFCDYFSNECF